MTAIPNTAENRDLAAAVNRRIKSDATILYAKSGVWWLGGMAGVILALGVGVGVALFGYSYINDSRTSADKMADAFAAALKHASLDGTIRLDPDTVLKLSPTTVKMEPGVVSLEPTTVALAPGSTVRVVPTDRPTQQQLNGSNPKPANPSAKVVTNYTIFKNVTFGDAIVATGWIFANSEQVEPSSQYCYYVTSADANTLPGVSVRQDLANDGKFFPAATGYKNVNGREAAKSCMWNDGQPTRFDSE